MIKGTNYIGKEQSTLGNSKYATFNPKTNENTNWEFTEATPQEINTAAELAATAFEAYKAVSPKQRATFLRTIATEIEALGSTLIDAYTQESGLPEGRAMGERGRTMGQLNAFANLLEEGSWLEATIDNAQPNRQPMPKVDIRKMLVPIGPIAVFGASNFPFAFSTAGGDTASVLAAGCPVIVKSHPMHAGTSELVAGAVLVAAEKTGMPNGVFSHLNSRDNSVGEQLVKHPKVKGVGFTGSIKGGTALYRLANERPEPIPVFAEMGSINPVVLLPNALTDKNTDWASQVASSITMGAGQFCTNPGLLIGLKSTALDTFTKDLGNAIEKIEPTCMLHPNIYNGYENGKAVLSKQGGVEVVGEYEENSNPNFAKQKVVTVNGFNFLKNPTLHQEVFGPFSVVVRCENLAELTKVIQVLEGQLTGTILGESSDFAKYAQVITALQQKVGRIIFNGLPTGVEVCASMQHGGPFPASTDSRFTSVGTGAIKRWVRPLSYQNWPNEALPLELQNENPLGIMRLVDGEYRK